MTRAPFSADDLTTAINTAARRMTSSTPSSDLRARVMSQIDVAQPRWGWRLAIAGSAIGAIALTAALTWQPAPAAQFAVAPESATPAARVAADPTATTIASSPVLSTASASHAATVSRVFALGAGQVEWRARAVQALEEPTALVVEPLDAARQQIDPIDITPLSVAPLTVPALTSGGRQ